MKLMRYNKLFLEMKTNKQKNINLQVCYFKLLFKKGRLIMKKMSKKLMTKHLKFQKWMKLFVNNT